MRNFIINKLYVEVTNKCNLKCRHCYNDSNGALNDEMDMNLLMKLLFRIKEYSKIKQIIISGGEVTLYPYLECLLKFLGSEKMSYTIITNGIEFSRSLYKYLDSQLSHVQISLEGPTAFENDYIRGKGSFNKAIFTLKDLREHRINTYLRFSLTSQNYDKIEDMIILALDNKISRINFSNLFPYGRCKQNKDLFMTDAQLIKSLTLLTEYKKKYKNQIYIDIPDRVIGGCPIVNNYENIQVNSRIDVCGNLYLCQMFNFDKLSSGNIIDESIEGLLNSVETLNLVKLIDTINSVNYKCHSCFAYKICKNGCPAINLSNNTIFGDDGVCACRKFIMKKCLDNNWFL